MKRDPLLESSPSGVEQGVGSQDRPHQTVLRQFQICQRLGISDETWRRWVRCGRAPAPLDGFPIERPRWSVQSIEAFERGLRQARPGRRDYFTAHRRFKVGA